MTQTEFVAKYAGGHYGDVNSTEKRLSELAVFCWSAIKWKGTATRTALLALTGMENGDCYRVITTPGTLNTGDDEITTIVGDVVVYNGETDLWEFLASGAAINV